MSSAPPGSAPPASRGRGAAALAHRVRLSVEAADRVELLAADLAGPVIADRHGLRDYYLRRLLVAGDAAAVAFGLGATAWLSPQVDFGGHATWGLLTIPVWVLLFTLYGLYGHDARRLSHTVIDELPAIFHAVLVGSTGTWAYYNLVPGPKIEFVPMLVVAGLVCAAMMLIRCLVRTGARWLLGPERVLFVGSGASTGPLVQRMRDHAHYGLEPVGLVVDSSSRVQGSHLTVLGELEQVDVAKLITEHRIDRIVVEAAGFADEAILRLLRRCKQLSVKVSLLPAAFGVLGTGVQVDHVGGVTLLGINPPVLSRSSRLLKRSMDVCSSLALLVLTMPLIILTALAVKLTSPGPVFFRQERVGKGGKRFSIWKFRTMVVDAEALRQGLLAQSRDPNWLLLDVDPRITRIGRLLRRTSLDELPQLYNVLIGDMSLVGPRPLVPDEDRLVSEMTRNRLDLTPGVTGLWQVLGRTTIPFEEMVKLDYLYVTNWSLWGDVKLALSTVPAVFARRGVN